MKSNVENGELDEEDEEDEEEEGAEAEDALESAKLLLAGGIAGAVSKTATAPLARLTILYQVQGMTAAASGGTAATAAVASSSAAASAAVSPIAGLPLRQALRAVVEREGVASLWRGNLVTVLHRLPYSAVNFWAYERLSEAWIAAEDKRKESSGGGGNGGNGENGENEDETPLTSTTNSDTARRLACGGAAGMAACTLAYPLDLVRTRLAASSAPAFSSGSASGGSGGGPSTSNKSRAFQPAPAPRLSVARTLGDVVRADGPRGLYRGLGATLAQVGPSLALNYTAYGALRAKWMSGKEPGEPPTVSFVFFSFFFFLRFTFSSQRFSHLFFLLFHFFQTSSPPLLLQIMMSLVCGAAAGLISSTATFPLDLVRRRMQLGGASAVSPGPPAAAGSSGSPPGIDGIKSVKPPRPTYAGVVRDVLARAGPAGFYAGIMPEYYKVAPGVAIGFCTYEACRELLGVSPSLAFR